MYFIFFISVSVNTAGSVNEGTTRIGIFSGGVLLGILLTVAVCFVIRKKRQSQKKQGKQCCKRGMKDSRGRVKFIDKIN